MLGKSRDDPLLRQLGIPRTVDEITTMTIEDFQRYIRPLTNEMQLYLKKIRRRGKNKMAARNSRARRETKALFNLDNQLTDSLQSDEYDSLLNQEQDQLKHRIHEEENNICYDLQAFGDITPPPAINQFQQRNFDAENNNQNFNYCIGY